MNDFPARPIRLSAASILALALLALAGCADVPVNAPAGLPSVLPPARSEFRNRGQAAPVVEEPVANAVPSR